MKKYVYLGLMSMAPFMVSANQISAEFGVEIMAVNGVEVKGKSDYQINDGFNQIVVRMSKRLTNGSSRDQFISSPYIISFDTDKDVDIDVPKVTSYSDAETKFRHGPDWRITASGQNLSYNSAYLPGKEGFMPYGDLAAVITTYNNQHNIVLSADADTIAGELKSVQQAKSNEASKQLKLWYKKASVEQREEFRRWMESQ